MDAAMVDRLATGEGWALLQSLPAYDESAALQLQEKLREAYDPDLVAAAMSQSRLRAKAVDKFGNFAAGMLFARRPGAGHRLPLAARHAHRFASAVRGL